MTTAFQFSADGDEALLLFEAISRLDDAGALKAIPEEERAAIWSLHCALEKQLIQPFDPCYGDVLASVRAAVRKRGLLVALTEEEKIGVHNAVNEVCHGIDIADAEFKTRLGCERAELANVLKKL